MFLNYNLLENSIKNYKIDEILSAIDAVCLKYKNQKKQKKKKKNKNYRLDYSENTQKEFKSNINGENSKNLFNKINLNEGIIDAKSDKDANKIIISGDDKKYESNDRENLNQSENLNEYLNKIINNINNNIIIENN